MGSVSVSVTLPGPGVSCRSQVLTAHTPSCPAGLEQLKRQQLTTVDRMWYCCWPVKVDNQRTARNKNWKRTNRFLACFRGNRYYISGATRISFRVGQRSASGSTVFKDPQALRATVSSSTSPYFSCCGSQFLMKCNRNLNHFSIRAASHFALFMRSM